MKLLLIADIHANYEALRTLTEVPHDRVICLGDIVDYGPEPDKCINLLREKVIPTIRGNHDNAVAFKVDADVDISISIYQLRPGNIHGKFLTYLE